jgi:hydrogenase nickel incorporation protein HypB
MCTECGCGLPGKSPAKISGHDHDHDHGHHHHHPHSPHTHDHEHSHEHSHAGEEPRRNVAIHRAILEKNNRQAERNRGFFHARGLLVLNVLSSPGSGKTTLIRETIRALDQRLKTAVIVGDLETDNDARRLRETSAQAVQITTGTMCHLEAEMVARAVKQLRLDGVQLLIIENVGNLVCPASYDLGEDLRVVLLSVTEGEDKPLK